MYCSLFFVLFLPVNVCPWPCAGREERSYETMWTSPDGRWLAFAGNQGSILLLDASSKRLVTTLKMNGLCNAGCFSADSSVMFTHGSDAEIYLWDLRSTKRCLHSHMDEGCVHGTAIACAPSGLQYAAGYVLWHVSPYSMLRLCSFLLVYIIHISSNAGVVNVYSTTDPEYMHSHTPHPVSTFMNLTTAITELHFNHDSQLLTLSSHRVKDALRVVHVPTLTVYRNWPSQKTPLHYVSAVGFSPSDSRFVSIGNDRGRCLLYKLNFYNS